MPQVLACSTEDQIISENLYKESVHQGKVGIMGSEREQAPFHEDVKSKSSPMCNKILEVSLKTEFLMLFLILILLGLGVTSLKGLSFYDNITLAQTHRL